MPKEEITALLRKLVSFRTTSDNPKELNKCIGYIKHYLPKSLIVRRYVKNSKPSLVVTFGKSKKTKLFFACHLDVVPAPDSMFVPRIKGKKMFARGSYDDKGSATALICLMKDFALNRQKPNIGLILTTDEETGGENGLGYLLKKEKYKSDFAIVPDAGKDFNIVIKEKGVLRAKLAAKGKAAHGSKPWRGDNAIEKLINAYSKIKEAFPKTTPKNRWKATINLGRISGGDAVNRVPDYAEAELDIRFTENEPEREIIEKIKNKIRKIKGVKVEFSMHRPPLVINPKNRHVLGLKSSLEKALNKKIELQYEHGASDASYFSEKKIPVALVMPNGANAHGGDEYIDLDSLQVFYRAMRLFIEQNVK